MNDYYIWDKLDRQNDIHLYVKFRDKYFAFILRTKTTSLMHNLHTRAVFAAVVVSVPVAFLNEKIIDSYY
jgi:hypothetical protein